MTRITRRGQITIPVGVRRRLGLDPHTEVAFEVDGEALLIRRVVVDQAPGRAVAERLRGRGDVPMSTDEIMALTRR